MPISGIMRLLTCFDACGFCSCFFIVIFVRRYLFYFVYLFYPMFKKRLCLSLLFSLVIHLGVFSVNRNYQVGDGLSYNSVWSLHFDSKGFLWIGTKDGLNRFDGRDFKVYQRQLDDDSSLGNNFVRDIEETSDGRLLIGTNNGLYLFNRKMDSFVHVVLDMAAANQPVINSILEDYAGSIWVGTHGKGLYRLDDKLQVVEHFVKKSKTCGLPSDFIWTMNIDSHNNLWLGTAGSGICLWNAHTRSFNSFSSWKGLTLIGQTVYSILPDKDGTLWIGTASSGLIHFSPASNTITRCLGTYPNIRSITDYGNNELIMGSEHGLIVIDRRTRKQRHLHGMEGYEQNYNAIFELVCDKHGGIWTGTYFNGLNYLQPNPGNGVAQVKIGRNSLSRSAISSITESPDGKMLISTHNSSVIYEYDTMSKSVSDFHKLATENVQDMIFYNNSLIVGTSGHGVDVLEYPRFVQRGHIEHKLAEGRSIFTLSNGDIILMREQGGAVYCPLQGKEVVLDKLGYYHLSAIVQDKQGNIWFSTFNNGLFIWNKNGKWAVEKNLRYGNRNVSLSNLTCMTILGNELWICTEDKGILVMDIASHEILRTIDASNGLYSNVVYSICTDRKGNVWATTKDNIVCMESGTGNIRFMGRQGKETPSNLHRAYESRDGKLYFGGTNGFFVVDPAQAMAADDEGANIMLTGLFVNSVMVKPGSEDNVLSESIESVKQIVLDDGMSNFSISFALLDYASPEENIYRYRLDGVDAGWVYSRNNYASYINLPSGRYLFHVSGSNGNGRWSEEKTVEIIIKPPFMFSPFMLVLYVIALIVFAVMGVRIYKAQMRRQQAERQKEFEIVHEREMYEQKINFFTNIAHEIRTPLSLIAGPLEAILRDNNLSDEHHYLETIQRNTNRLFLLVNQLLDFRKIENDMFQLNIRYQKIDGVLQRVYEQYAPEAEANGIELSLIVRNKDALGYIDAEALYKIVSNLLSNALKFCNKTVRVVMEVHDGRMLVTVTDDGKGIKTEHHKNLFQPFYQVNESSDRNRGTGLGLSLSRSLAIKMNGQLRIDETYSAGARFILELPAMSDIVLTTETNVPEQTDFHGSADKQKPCILVVEDNDDLSEFISSALSRDYMVITAENGKRGIEAVTDNDVDIIISDVMMPVMDGLELCQQLKNSQEHSHLPIILLSAKTDLETKLKGLKGGADVYLEKPFSVEQLTAQIESILLKRRQLHKRIMNAPLDYYKRSTTNADDSSLFLKQLTGIILERMSDRDFNVDMLVKEFATNRSDFQKKVKKVTGLTPNDYIKLIRMNRSAELLATGKYRINEVCAIVGFNSPSYFSKCFHEQFGKLPKDFIT